MIAKILTSRLFQFAVLPLVIFGWFLLTDPSSGADTAMRIQLWAQALLVTGLAYAVAKSLLGNASSEDLYTESLKGNQAAGHAYLGVCLMRAIVLAGLLAFFAMLQG